MNTRRMLLAFVSLGALLGGAVLASAATSHPNTTAPVSAAEPSEGSEPNEAGDAPGGPDTGPNVDHQFEGEEEHAD
ncbi:MAG: hypothetical protein ACYDCK_02480 [Thermoplasmatota archaeon]